jgi:hypothetical protein
LLWYPFWGWVNLGARLGQKKFQLIFGVLNKRKGPICSQQRHELQGMPEDGNTSPSTAFRVPITWFFCISLLPNPLTLPSHQQGDELTAKGGTFISHSLVGKSEGDGSWFASNINLIWCMSPVFLFLLTILWYTNNLEV